MADDAVLGAKVLVGNRNWKAAGLWTALRVILFGRIERFEHLGCRIILRWWRGEPYLTSIEEAG